MDVLTGGTYLFASYGVLKALGAVSTKLGVKKSKDAIANIPLYGQIQDVSLKSSFFGSNSGITPREVKDNVEKALDKNVKGIIFEINSPGGGVAPSKEITDYIKDIEIPTVALVKSYAASGGYMIASACDKIVINPQGSVGSIGVILSHIEYSVLAERLGIRYDGIKAGEYKDMGTPFRSFTEKERKILEDELKEIHNEFITEVSENRDIHYDDVLEIANGLIYHGKKSIQLNLVDKLGYIPEAIKLIEELGQFEHSKILDIPRRKKFGSFSNIFTNMGSSFAEGIYTYVLSNQKPPEIR